MDAMPNENRGAPGQGSESSGQIRLPDEERPQDWPRYRLTAKSYINDVMREVGSEVTLDPRTGQPGRNMEPINEAAKAQWMAHKERLTQDPLAHLMISPSSYEIQPHHLAALDAVAGSLGMHPLGSKHPAHPGNRKKE